MMFGVHSNRTIFCPLNCESLKVTNKMNEKAKRSQPRDGLPMKQSLPQEVTVCSSHQGTFVHKSRLLPQREGSRLASDASLNQMTQKISCKYEGNEAEQVTNKRGSGMQGITCVCTQVAFPSLVSYSLERVIKITSYKCGK